MTLPTTIVEGQLGHNADHVEIAGLFSSLASSVAAVTSRVSAMEAGGSGWTNVSSFRLSGGTNDQFPVGSTIGRVDEFGSLVWGRSPMTPSTLLQAGVIKGSIVGFAYLAQAQRLFARAIRIAEHSDPADFNFARFGPEQPSSNIALTARDQTGNGPGGSIGQIRMTPALGAYKSFATFTIDTAGVCTTTVNHGRSANDKVFLNSLSGSSGLTNKVFYYLSNVTSNTFTLSSSTNSAGISALTTGNGEYYLTAARDEETSLQIAFQTDELPRRLTTGNDYAVGSRMRFSITRNGRGAKDDVMELSENGQVNLGLGAIGVNDGLVSIRGDAGQNEKNTITFSNFVNGDTFTLYHYGAPPASPAVCEPKDSDAARRTANITWDSTTATTASNIQTALEALASIGAGNVTATASGTSVVVEFVNTLARTNFVRMGATTVTGSGTVSVSKTQAGIPGDNTQPLLFMQDNSSSPTRTTDYINIKSASSASVFSVSSAGRTVLGGDLQVGSSATTFRLRLPSTVNTSTSIGTTGAAAAPPATPEVYIRVVAPNAAGVLTTLSIPAYIAP